MTYTLLIYLIILGIMLLSTATVPFKHFGGKYGEFTHHNQHYILRYIFPIMIYTIFWGVRYGVGTDYFAYQSDFANPMLISDRLEIGYKLLVSLLSYFNNGFLVFLLITSFVNIVSVYSISRYKGHYFLLFAIFFFWSTGTVLSAQNGIRQMLATSVFLIGMHPFVQRRWSIWLIIIFAASCFHKTIWIPAIILMLLGIFPKIQINKYLLVSLYLFLEFFGYSYQGLIFSWFEPIISTMDYEHYTEAISSSLNSSIELSSGIGMILRTVLTSIIILNQDNSIYYTSKKNLTYYMYMIFLLGILLSPIFSGNQILYRVVSYFTMLSFFTYATVCTDLLKRRYSRNDIKSLIVVFIVVTYLAFFCVTYQTNSCGVYKIINLL